MLLQCRNHQMVVTLANLTNQQAALLVEFTAVLSNEEVEMGKLPFIAVAGVMWALPATAEIGSNTLPSEPGVTLARVDVCVGPDCRRERHHDRCREVTLRERRGGEVVVRHERRCD